MPLHPTTRRRSPVAKYPFLSQEWMDEARKVRDKYKGKTPAIPHQVRMNQVITDVPFGDGTLHSHMDTSSGELVMEEGHLDEVDLTVTLDYATAKAIFVEGNPQAGMQAFMEGKVKLQGDLTKLMAAQVAGTGPGAPGLAEELSAITE